MVVIVIANAVWTGLMLWIWIVTYDREFPKRYQMVNGRAIDTRTGEALRVPMVDW